MATIGALLPPALAAASVDFPSLIDSIGEPSFGVRLVTFLHGTCRTDHAAVWQLAPDRSTQVLAVSMDHHATPHRETAIYAQEQLWRREPTLRYARARVNSRHGTVLIRAEVSRLTDPRLRELLSGANICDRLHVYGPSQHGMIGLGLVRVGQTDFFSPADIEQVSALSRSLLAVIAKHIAVQWGGRKLEAALASLSDIEACVAAAPEALPRREAEVCARTVYGMSTPAIAADLGISAETVVTYRKRTNLRLGVAAHNELLRWYLATWGRGGGAAGVVERGATAPTSGRS